MNHITQKIMIMTTLLLLSLSGKAQVAVVSNSDSKEYDVGEIPVNTALLQAVLSVIPSLSMCILTQKSFNPICPLCTIANSVERH